MAETATDPLVVEGVRITHPEKVLWPSDGYTKRDLLDYYLEVAPCVAPLIAERPLTLRTFPQGINRPGFFRKHAPKGRPRWLQTWTDVAESTGEPVEFVVGHGLRTLIWLVQFNVIELHPWLSRIDRPNNPDLAVIDLDPDEDTPFERVIEAAQLFGEALEARDLESLPKLTGSRGIHIMVPLDRSLSFDHVRDWVHDLARVLVRARPDLLTLSMARAERGGRILVDYAQNARGKNTVAAYSARARPGAPVAAPLTWEELERPGLRPNQWTIKTLPDRLAHVGDLMGPLMAVRQRLPEP